MAERLLHSLLSFRLYFIVSLSTLLVSSSFFSFTGEHGAPKKIARDLAASPPIRKAALRSFDTDPIRFTLQADKQTAIVGEEITITITAHYLNIPSTLLFTTDGSNGFRLKALLPDGFVQTGGDYIDYIGTTLTASTPTVVYKLIGHFEKPSNKAKFRLLRGSFFADATGQFVEKARLFILATPVDQLSSGKAQARSANCNYYEGQYLLNNGTEAMYAHYYNGVLYAGYQDGSNFRPQHWLIATGQMTTEQASCFAEGDPHTTSSPPSNPSTPTTPSGNCGYMEGQYLFTFNTEAMYAHYYNGVLYAAYQDGSNFRPQHWLVATGQMASTTANCFAEDDPYTTSTPTPTTPAPSTPSSTCGYSEGQYLFTFGTEAMYAHYYNGVLYAAYQDGNNFRPQHWLVATGLMTSSVANCFAENDPHNGTSNPTSPPQPSNSNCGTGNGLTGLYSNSLDLSSNLVAIRTDNQINFNWADSPIQGVVNADGFSVRWFGQVEAPVSGNYTFKTNNDDGTRLWVNGQQLIEDWNGHGPTWQQSSIYLTAGQKYDIIIDYFDLWGGAQAQLYWEYPGQSLQLVPSCRLYSNNQSFSYNTSSPSDSRIPVCSISIGYVTYYTQCGSGIVIDYTDNTPTSNPPVEYPTGTSGGTYGGIGRPKSGITSPINPNIYYVPGGATNPVTPILQPVGTSSPSATQTALNNFYAAMRAKGIIFTYDEKAVIDEYSDLLIDRISTFVAQYGTKPDGRNAFILSSADQQNYPRFAEIVKNTPNFVDQYDRVKQALIRHTNLPWSKIKVLLQFGSGPKIVVNELSPANYYGHTVYPAFPEPFIEISARYVRGLEAANLSGTREATTFLLTVTLLHELTHYGAVDGGRNESRNDEFGNDFEREVLGTTITKNNAGQLSVDFYKKN